MEDTTLTPDKLYDSIQTRIRATDEISFKLISLVPLASGTGLVALLGNHIPIWSQRVQEELRAVG